MKAYNTVRAESEIEYIVQKSRFIGRCFPVSQVDEALSRLESIRKENWDATHNCYAYVIGEDSSAVKFSDDGEPGGTAGMPMMEVLKVKKLTNVIVVVTRYFGGILLGAGGLVRAYSKSCSEAVAAAGVIEMTPSQRITLKMPYPLWAKFENKLRDGEMGQIRLDTPTFAEDVTVDCIARESDADAFLKTVIEASDGRLTPLCGELSYEAWDV